MTTSVRSNAMLYAMAMLSVIAAAVLLHLLWDHTGYAPAVLVLCAMALSIGLLYAGKRRAERMLRDRDVRLQLVSQQIPGGLWSTNDDLVITSGFGAQSALLHGSAGTTLYEHYKTQDKSFAPIAAHLRALRGESNNYELQWAGRTFQCYVEPLRDLQGRIFGVVGIATDITDRKQSEEERERLVQLLEEQRQRLDTTNRAKDRFLAMLSHELRTPLSPVLTLTSELETREELPVDVREDLATIKRNVELEATLIDDLLDLTRIARGKLQLQFDHVDVHELLRNVIDICRSDLHRKRIQLTVEMAAPRHGCRGDAARLQQIFWNLVKNAIKFTPEGGSITVRTACDNERLVVEVIDSGIGIDAAHLPIIFDAFEQGSESITRQFGGLGLGLAISKALVDSHQGHISAHSQGAGQGATFRVELQAMDAPQRPAGNASGDWTAHAPQLKILVVEDHEDTAKVLGRLLKSAGHTVATAKSVAGALEVLERTSVDLLISDLGLPDGNGMDLMREVAAKYGLKGIALSGYGTEDDVQKALQSGFSAHLTKPVPVNALRQTVARVSAGV